MSLDAQRQYVESTLQSRMHATYPAVPIKFENVKFQQPETPWVALCLLDGKAFPAELGPKVISRHVGLVQVDVFVPALTGTKQLNLISTFIGLIFRNTNVHLSDGANVRFREPEYTSRGLGDGFARMMVRTVYWRDEPRQ